MIIHPVKISPDGLFNEEDIGFKNRIIAQYLSTPQGRQKLAASMVQPLRTTLDYQGLARKVFTVQPLSK